MATENIQELVKTFESLKALLTQRAASVMGEAMLKAFISSLDQYHDAVLFSFNETQKKASEAREENELLRGLVGAVEPEVRATILRQGEETRFLREQLLGMKKSWEESRTTQETLALEKESLKRDLATVRTQREDEQKKYSENLAGMQRQLDEFGRKVAGREQELEQERRLLSGRLREAEIEARESAEQEMRTTVILLNNLYAGVGEALTALAEHADTLTDVSAQLAPDIDLMKSRLIDTTAMLTRYIQVFTFRPPQAGPVEWPRFWDERKKKNTAAAGGKKLTLRWPDPKTLPPFSTDPEMLSELCDIFVQNALEALPAGGTLAVEGAIGGGLTLRFIDTGAGVKPEHRSKLFTPFFTTKPGRFGFGLARARGLARALGGTAAFEAGEGRTIFSVTLPQGKRP